MYADLTLGGVKTRQPCATDGGGACERDLERRRHIALARGIRNCVEERGGERESVEKRKEESVGEEEWGSLSLSAGIRPGSSISETPPMGPFHHRRHHVRPERERQTD